MTTSHCLAWGCNMPPVISPIKKVASSSDLTEEFCWMLTFFSEVYFWAAARESYCFDFVIMTNVIVFTSVSLDGFSDTWNGTLSWHALFKKYRLCMISVNAWWEGSCLEPAQALWVANGFGLFHEQEEREFGGGLLSSAGFTIPRMNLSKAPFKTSHLNSGFCYFIFLLQIVLWASDAKKPV